MTSTGPHGIQREIWCLMLMCLLVCVGAWVSAELSAAVGTVSSVWIANGIITAFVLVAQPRWKATYFLVGQLSNLGVDLALGDPVRWACWFALCNSSEILITALAMGHLAGRADIAGRRPFAKLVLFGMVLGPLICALAAAPLSSFIDKHTFVDSVRIWFLADALGGAVILPPMLFLLTRERVTPRSTSIRFKDLGLCVLLAGIAFAVFWQTRYPVIFMLIPPLMVLVFRFKLDGAVYCTSMLLLLGAASTAEGHGPFSLAREVTPTERIVLFQIFGLVVFGTCVPLGFLMLERDLSEGNLKEANRRLADLALLDPLTGVRNRRSFDIALEGEWARAHAVGDDISLLYLDVDYFKRFNDTYGHQEGDNCLRSVAGALSGSVRSSIDVVARYGGEEFVILLPGVSEDLARATANRVAEAIANLRISHQDSPFGFVTASVGAATARPRDGSDPYRLVQMADDCLYEAKRSGRHRIESTTDSRFAGSLMPA